MFEFQHPNKGKKIGIKGFLSEQQKQELIHCGELNFSSAGKCWYLPYEKLVYTKLKERFKEIAISRNDAPSVATVCNKHSHSIAEKANALPSETSSPSKDFTEHLRIIVPENKGWQIRTHRTPQPKNRIDLRSFLNPKCNSFF